FKSIQQALAIELISRGCPHVLVVLPTGAGKTAIYGSPGYVEKAGFRLVIIPYRSLFDQVTQEARAKGLPHAIFPSNNIDLFRSRLVFVSLERCAQSDFRTWCIANKNANLLRGIIVDEAHDIIMSADYRHSFKKLMKLTDLNVQIALLTATLSPRSEVALLESLQMDPLSVRKVRMPTHRPEIQYRVTRVAEDTIDNDILSIALSSPLQSHERGIIFVLTTTCCDELAGKSGFPSYHGQLADEERNAAMLRWRSGKSQWIVGTLAMAQGIDVRSVRVIINREISWVGSERSTKVLTMVHFAQMSGRAGRDGKPS
ncbi:P-loop containing nucleoside triphosphate hydrolase protein, partial [Suillus weaverae]